MFRSILRLTASIGACLLGLTAGTPSVAGPVTVDYELTALASPGRYEYRYTLTNVSLATPLAWFSVDFDTTLYDEASLLITSAGPGGWSEQILGSVLAVPAQYDAYKTAGAGLNIGDTESGFTVEFTWLGAGTPGSQAFTVYDPGTLDVLDSGVTTARVIPPPSMPEPSSAALALLALCGVAAATRRRARAPMRAARTA